MTRPGISPGAQGEYPQGFAHMSFSVGSAELVDRLSKTLNDNGYAIADGPRRTGDGFYESCIIGSEGIHVEITAFASTWQRTCHKLDKRLYHWL